MTPFEEMTQVQEPDTSPRGLLGEEIRKHIREKGSIKKLECVYGTVAHCHAYEEEILKPGLGTFTKLYGCPLLYPAEINRDVIDRVALTKATWMEDLRFLFGIKWLLFPSVPLMVLFNGKFIKELVVKYATIYAKELEHWQPPDNEFCAVSREILRVSKKIVDGLDESWDKKCHWGTYRQMAYKMAYCFPMFIQNDNAYLSRTQDALWAGQGGWKLTLDILIAREEQIAFKFLMIRKLVKFLRFVSPKFREMVDFFFKELDLNEIKPTEADIYFTLRRDGYQYFGRTLEERCKEAERIDKEQGIVILPI